MLLLYILIPFFPIDLFSFSDCRRFWIDVLLSVCLSSCPFIYLSVCPSVRVLSLGFYISYKMNLYQLLSNCFYDFLISHIFSYFTGRGNYKSFNRLRGQFRNRKTENKNKWNSSRAWKFKKRNDLNKIISWKRKKQFHCRNSRDVRPYVSSNISSDGSNTAAKSGNRGEREGNWNVENEQWKRNESFKR